MESVKQQNSQRTVIVSFGVAAVALTAAIFALTFTVYLHQDGLAMKQIIATLSDDLKEHKERIHKLEQMSPSSVTDEDNVVRLFKRSVDDTQSSNDELLSQLTLQDITALRGPPGRDGRNGQNGANGNNGVNGRDGKDGKDCNPEDINALVSLLSQNHPEADVNTDEMLERFNETIGHSLLRAIQLANSKLTELEKEENQVQPATTSSTNDGSSTGVRGGSTYVRWGRTTCANSSEIIYSGFAAGQYYSHTGGASNYQCLPLQPEFSTYVGGDQLGNYIYGAEYETGSHILTGLQNRNVPCARCYVPTRSASMMIPAKVNCPAGWTKEYSGYLMAGHNSHKRAYAYECVDKDPEVLPGLTGNTDGALFYFQQVHCPSTGHCPPYIEGAELACVVCTK